MAYYLHYLNIDGIQQFANDAAGCHVVLWANVRHDIKFCEAFNQHI